jgi:hypothetical protein
VTGVVFVVFVYLFNDSLPIIGLLWNPRLLPMLNMCRYLLAAVGVVEITRALTRLAAFERTTASDPLDDAALERRTFRSLTAAAIACFLVALVVLGFRFQVLPFGKVTDEGQGSEYSWGPFETKASNKGFVDGWARWNFSGYEGRAAYGEYYDLVQQMKSIGEDRGCGRALWENYKENDKYGTTMALMLLPFWTDGCIGSSEGLFFEAAGTTPYHFLAAAAMSKQSSNPVRELRYVDNDASVGIGYMRALGIRYFLGVTPEAIAQATSLVEAGDVELIASSGPWRIYEVSDADVVTPLAFEPVVVNGRSGDQRERWLELGTSWLQQPDEWTALPAADGPAEWQRVSVAVDLTRRQGEPGSDSRKVDIVEPEQRIVARPLTDVEVSDVEVGEQSVSFSVDQVGVPVLVRVSYFPNWKVDGAKGPYRVAPNMMVVVPTKNDVRLEFSSSNMDRLAYGLTLVGLGVVLTTYRRQRRDRIRSENQ